MSYSWEHIKYIYFLGIGGIGMSALARYFHSLGKIVYGYDRTETLLTQELSDLGIEIHYADSVHDLPQNILLHKPQSLVIYTPAIASNNVEYNYFINEGYTVIKRSKALGYITQSQNTICVAGTHGKTTTSTLLAHLLNQTPEGCNAFLGGISKNYNSNLILSPTSNRVVVEADEYDRSFLQLTPSHAIITSVDADHLDIYNEKDEFVAGFEDFTKLIKEEGTLVIRKNLHFIPRCKKNTTVYHYALQEKCDFYATNITTIDKLYHFDIHTPWGIITDVKLNMPGLINVENAIAATAQALIQGATFDEIRKGLATFQGIARRFDYKLNTPQLISIDDYAHHPQEIESVVRSVRTLYPEYVLTAVFQPHLYSRTRDFATEFAENLSKVDQLFLLDIYPAREEPIEGITSSILFDKITLTHKELCTALNLKEKLSKYKHQLVLFMGAGDISLLVEPITEFLAQNK